MVWSKPFGAAEIEYIGNHYPQMSCAEIAEKLGRSEQGVRNVVKRIGIAQSRPRALEERIVIASPDIADGDGGRAQDELAELRELKRLLKRSMREDAGPQSLPRLAAEYRETVKRISELEGGGNGGGRQGDLAGLIGFVPIRSA